MIHPKVESLDFSAIKRKMLDPVEGNGLSTDEIELAEREYRRFLSLRIYERSIDLVPSRLVDEFWHAHILDTLAYVRDCQEVFGEYLHHYPYLGIGSDVARHELKQAFEKTKAAYEEYFGPYPHEMSASRCQDHACHVPTSCACRVPGACRDVRLANGGQ